MSLEKITGGLVDLLKEAGIEARNGYDETVPAHGDGLAVVSVTDTEPIQHGLPDYKLGIEVSGMTMTDNDPDRKKFNLLYGAVKRRLMGLAVEEIAVAAESGAVGWVFTGDRLSDGGGTRSFSMSFDLFVTDFTF